MTKKLIKIQVKPRQQDIMCSRFGISKQTLRNILAFRTANGRNGDADDIRAAALNLHDGRKIYEEVK